MNTFEDKFAFNCWRNSLIQNMKDYMEVTGEAACICQVCSWSQAKKTYAVTWGTLHLETKPCYQKSKNPMQLNVLYLEGEGKR